MKLGAKVVDGERPNSGAVAIEPLKKTYPDGRPYKRRDKVEGQISELLGLPPLELVKRCEIRGRDVKGYVFSECLVHFVRQKSLTLKDHILGGLFRALMRRVLQTSWSGESKDGKRLNLKASATHDELRAQLLQFLATDRTGYSERLDYFEVSFDSALKKLRQDADKKVHRAHWRFEPVEDPDTGEYTEAVDTALQGQGTLLADKKEDSDYRSRMNAAIDTLPPLQQRIVEMYKNNIPFESQDPNAVPMERALKKTPKTLRKHYAIAIESLKKILEENPV